MTYKRRHQIIRYIPRVHSRIGAAKKALDIINKYELDWHETAELNDAIEDLWVLVDKLEANDDN